MKKTIVLLLTSFLLLASLPAMAQQWTTSGNDISNTNSGNVGIGTSTPAYKLDVSGTIYSTGGITIGTGIGGTWAPYGTWSQFSSNTTTDAIDFLAKKSTSNIIFRVNNGGRGLMLNGTSGNVLLMGGSGETLSGIGNSNGTGNLTFLYSTTANSQTEGARLSNTGNFGIGTSNPTAKLEVNGDVKIVTGNTGSFMLGSYSGASHLAYDGSTGVTSMYLLKAGNIQTQTDGETRIRGDINPKLLLLNGAYIAGYQAPVTIKRIWSGIGNATLVLDDEGGVDQSTYKILQANFNGTEKAYIKGDGGAFFGGIMNIGTSTSTAGLTVNGSFTLANGTQGAGKILKSNAAGLATWEDAPSGSQWNTNGTSIFYNAGKVGIGTSAPSSQLDITGFFRSTGLDGVPSTGTGIEIFYHNAGFDKSFIQSYSRSQGVFKGMDIEGSFIRINTLSGGNVGIGTATPAYRLDITGNQRILGTIGIGTTPSGNGITINTSTGYISGYPIHATGNWGGFNAIRVDNSNTGVSSAAGLLMVNNSNYVGFMRMDGTNAGGVGVFPGQLNIQSQQSGIRYVSFGATTGSPSHIFYTGYPSNLERLRVDDTGVTVSNGTLVSPVYLGGTSPGSSLVLQSTSATGNDDANIKMLVGDNGSTEALRILNNGNILIGTILEAPGYKLAVKGNIIAEKVRVKLQSSGWPDYVFEPTYNLPTLQEIENFIHQHKHLPDVPAAATIEKEGLDLGDGQATLLKKIEELTLHLIEMNKRMEKIELENKQLQKKLAEK